MTISIPPGVFVKKEILQECQVYVFRHSELGQLGRIVVQALPNDQSHFSCELSGDPDDPTKALRQAVFVPLCEQIIGAMEATLGKGSLDGAILPSTRGGPTEVVESKLIPCERCGSTAAMLIFAEDATTTGRFEDCARKMYHKYTKLDVPTWIIGLPMGELSKTLTPMQVMKVWPKRVNIITTTADTFNEDLKALLEVHCSCQ